MKQEIAADLILILIGFALCALSALGFLGIIVYALVCEYLF